MALSTSTDTSGISGQTNTRNPQSATQPATGAAASGSVQPGTATSVLTSQQGISLHATALPTVTVGASTAQTQSASGHSAPPVTKHHVNPVLLSLPVILVLVAAILVWTTRRSVKSTTD